jgi:hypothetical protein
MRRRITAMNSKQFQHGANHAAPHQHVERFVVRAIGHRVDLFPVADLWRVIRRERRSQALGP